MLKLNEQTRLQSTRRMASLNWRNICILLLYLFFLSVLGFSYANLSLFVILLTMDDSRRWLRLQCNKLSQFLLVDSHRKTNDQKKRLYTYNSTDLYYQDRRNPHFQHEREMISQALRSSNSNLDTSGFRSPLFSSNNRMGLNSSRNGYESIHRDPVSICTSGNPTNAHMTESDLLSPFRPISLSTPKKQDLSSLKSILKKTPESQTSDSNMAEKGNTKAICYDRSKRKDINLSSVSGKSYKRNARQMNDGDSSLEESFPSGLSYSKRRATQISVNSGLDLIDSIDSKVPGACDIVSAAINLRLPSYSQSSSQNDSSRGALSVSHNRRLTIIPRVVLPTASRRPRVSLFKNKSKTKEIVEAVMENMKKPFSIDSEKIDQVPPENSVATTEVKTSFMPTETFTLNPVTVSISETPKVNVQLSENQLTSKITLIPQINIQPLSSATDDQSKMLVVSCAESTNPVASTPSLPLIIPPSASIPLTLPTISVSTSIPSLPSCSSDTIVNSAISNPIPKFEFKLPSTETSTPSVSLSISIPQVSSFGNSATTTTIPVSSTTQSDVETKRSEITSTQGSINTFCNLSQTPITESESKPCIFPVISTPFSFPSTSSTVSSGIASIPSFFPKISFPDISTQSTSTTSVSIPSTSTSSPLFSAAPKVSPIFVSSNLVSNTIEIPKNISVFSTPSTTTTNNLDFMPMSSSSEITTPVTTTSLIQTNSNPSFNLPKFNFASMPITTSSTSSMTSIFPTSSTSSVSSIFPTSETAMTNSSPFPSVQPIPSLSAIFAPKDQSSLSLPFTPAPATTVLPNPSSSSIFGGATTDSFSTKVTIPSSGFFGVSTVTTTTTTNSQATTMNPISSIFPSVSSSEQPKFSFNLSTSSNQFSSTSLPSKSGFSFSANPIQSTQPSSNAAGSEGGFKFEFKPPDNSNKPFTFRDNSGSSSSLTPFTFNLTPSNTTNLFGAGATQSTPLFSNPSNTTNATPGGSGFSFGNFSTQPSGSSVPSSSSSIFNLNSSTPFSNNPIGGQTNQNTGNSTSSNQRILIRPRRRH